MDSDMQLWRGLYMPASEQHMLEWMGQRNQIVDGVPTYQYDKLRRAMEFVKQHRAMIDVGAHCGLWSMHLVKAFDMVYAFEPIDLHRRCFRLNVTRNKYQLYECALGDHEGGITMYSKPTSSGGSWVYGEGDIPLCRLDLVSELWIEDVDFIKLDCEGYEYFALKGGEDLLKRCKPCVLVEQKPNMAQKFGLGETQAVDYLLGLGAKLRFKMSGDYCLSWD